MSAKKMLGELDWHFDFVKPPSPNELVGPPPHGLDEQYAIKNFLGKTSDEAQEMFRHNPTMAGDFAWMASGGLVYYLPPALNYLASNESNRDWEFTHSLLCSLSICVTWIKGNPLEKIREIAEYCDANREKFDIDIDDDLVNGYLRTIRKSCSTK